MVNLIVSVKPYPHLHHRTKRGCPHAWHPHLVRIFSGILSLHGISSSAGRLCMFSNTHSKYSYVFRLFAFAVSISEYNLADASAPPGVLQNSQFFLVFQYHLFHVLLKISSLSSKSPVRLCKYFKC